MARNVTLSQLRTDVAVQCDFVIGASGRYTPTIITRYLNQSVQRFRERVSNEGMTHYLASASGTITSGATSPYSFKSLDVTTLLSGAQSCVRVYGVDLTVNGIVKTLAHRPFQERNDFGAPTVTGEPMAWAMYQTTKIAIMPAPNDSYSVTVWYLPMLADMSADGDTFDGVAGWEQWIVWDVVCQLIARDQYQAAYNQAVQLRSEIWQDVLRGATKVTSAGGAIVGRDTLRASGFGRRAFCGPVASGGSGLPPDGSVTNAMLASAPEATIKGRARGAGAGSPTDLVPAQAAAIVAVYSGGAAGLVPTGAGSTTLFLREDATWAAPSVGGSVSGLALTQIQDINPDRVLGRVGPATGATQQLTGQQVASMIGVFTGAAHGLVPFPSGGLDSTLFLAGDARWRTPAGGGGGGTGASPSALFFFPPLTALGNFSSASGVSEFLSRGQVASLLPLFGTASGSTRGLVYSPTAGVANRFLRDDGSFQGVPSFAPTGIQFTQLQAILEPSILGRVTAGSGVTEQLTPTQVATMLPAFTVTGKGMVPPPGTLAAAFLRDDGVWAAPPGGGGGSNNPGGPTGSFQFNLGSGMFGGASGFSISASGINVLHDVTMPTGVIRMGYTGVAQAGLWRTPHGADILRSRRADGADDLPWLRVGAVVPNVFTIGGGVEGVAGIDTETTTGHLRGRVGNATKTITAADQFRLEAGIQLALRQQVHGASTDKLAAWTPSGFANIATGITVGASGMNLSVASGGPELSASGIAMRGSDMHGVRRINGLDGIKLFGTIPGGGAASGSQEIASPSGTAFVVPETVTTGQIYALVPTLAVHADTVLLENRTGISHMVNNTGTGMGVPSFFVATLPPSGGMSFRFASGAWEVGNRYKLGGG